MLSLAKTFAAALAASTLGLGAAQAQEVLSTFSLELGEVILRPGTGGIFEIILDGELIWERKRDGGFPDVKHLKQMVRDRIDPDRDLGHIDRAGHAAD